MAGCEWLVAGSRRGALAIALAAIVLCGCASRGGSDEGADSLSVALSSARMGVIRSDVPGQCYLWTSALPADAVVVARIRSVSGNEVTYQRISPVINGHQDSFLHAGVGPDSLLVEFFELPRERLDVLFEDDEAIGQAVDRDGQLADWRIVPLRR